MVKVEVLIKASLENIVDLQPSDNDFNWLFIFECSQCGESSKNPQALENLQSTDLSRRASKEEYVLGICAKCKFCKRENSAMLMVASKSNGLQNTIHSYSDSDQWKRLCVLDCRGMAPKEFVPDGIWTGRGQESNCVFDDILIDSKDGWAGYDTEKAVPVGVYNCEFDFNDYSK
ncbi:hypothetical protein ACOME3_005836 [Neoechinorhynchus agilis]